MHGQSGDLFDACERLVPSDRFTTKELDPLTRLFQWAIGEGITPVMIDHTNKDRPKKGEGPLKPMDKLYGARAKSAVSDVMLHGTGNAELLAGGISKALITTAAGLIVAIPSLMFFRHFRARVDAYTLTMEQASERMVPHLLRPFTDRRPSSLLLPSALAHAAVLGALAWGWRWGSHPSSFSLHPASGFIPGITASTHLP